MTYLAHKILGRKKDGKKFYPWAWLPSSCLAHDSFYSDTLAQSSICSLPAQCSLNFNEEQYPKFTAKCTYPTNVTISNFTYSLSSGKKIVCLSNFIFFFLLNTLERSVTLQHLYGQCHPLRLDCLFLGLSISQENIIKLKFNWINFMINPNVGSVISFRAFCCGSDGLYFYIQEKPSFLPPFLPPSVSLKSRMTRCQFIHFCTRYPGCISCKSS